MTNLPTVAPTAKHRKPSFLERLRRPTSAEVHFVLVRWSGLTSLMLVGFVLGLWSR